MNSDACYTINQMVAILEIPSQKTATAYRRADEFREHNGSSAGRPFPLPWRRLGACARADNSLSANNTRYLCRQFRQRRLYGIPNHVEIDVEVTMGDAVAHSAHTSPRYF